MIHSDIKANLERMNAYPMALRLCREYGVDFRAVASKCRLMTVAQCRHHIWMTIRHTIGASLTEIAIAWGNIDHTTVYTGIVKSEQRMMRNIGFVP